MNLKHLVGIKPFKNTLAFGFCVKFPGIFIS
jgi:hypothetical protein